MIERNIRKVGRYYSTTSIANLPTPLYKVYMVYAYTYMVYEYMVYEYMVCNFMYVDNIYKCYSILNSYVQHRNVINYILIR